MLSGQLGAQFLPYRVDKFIVQQAVGPGKIDKLKHAKGAAAGGAGPYGRAKTLRVDYDNLSGLQLSHVSGAQVVKGATLRRNYPAAVQLAYA